MNRTELSPSAFLAKYENGRVETFYVNSNLLSSGDHIARGIALDLQKAGKLPVGKIVHVKRA